MRSIRLVCDRVEHNHYKFYELALVQDIFGRWCVTRRWGRLRLSEAFEIRLCPDLHAAHKLFDRIERRKRNNGYVDAHPTNASACTETAQHAARSSITIVPRARYPILDHRLDAVFARSAAVTGYLRRLRHRGIVHLGHLVQAAPSTVLELADGDARLLAYVERRLAELDLRLGSRAPGWHKTVLPEEKDWLPLWSGVSRRQGPPPAAVCQVTTFPRLAAG